MHLSREQAFELWAPPASPWSVWCKPLTFSYLPSIVADHDLPPSLAVPVPWAPEADASTVLVIDLPGVQSVRIGESLACAGFRPVPLFNALPGPARSSARGVTSPSTLVDVYPIIDAIQGATVRLRDRLERLPTTAPPAFLLDSARRLGKSPKPGDFDNRSVSLPTDFPSAAFLQSRGVTRALLVLGLRGRTTLSAQPASDLAHTLLRWQNAGISMFSCSLDENLEGSEPAELEITRPSWFGAIWHNALSLVGLRRNPMGGFGGTLPRPSAG